MSILNEIKDKAKALLNSSEPYAVRQTNVYNSSDNRITVAGHTLDGVVNSSISADVITKQENGIDYYYTAIHQVLEERTLTVSVLPTATCLPIMRLLALKQQQTKGWFNISVHENGRIVNVYRGHILELPEIDMQREAPDRKIVFAIKPMFSGLSVIDQPTDFEAESYSKYGVRPDLGNAADTAVISETTGRVSDYEDLPLEDVEVPDLPIEELPTGDEPILDNLDDFS